MAIAVNPAAPESAWRLRCHPTCSQPGREGPWTTYARMVTLRTPKHLTGLDYGMPSLTFQVGKLCGCGDAFGELMRAVAHLPWRMPPLPLPLLPMSRCHECLRHF